MRDLTVPPEAPVLRRDNPNEAKLMFKVVIAWFPPLICRKRATTGESTTGKRRRTKHVPEPAIHRLYFLPREKSNNELDVGSHVTGASLVAKSPVMVGSQAAVFGTRIDRPPSLYHIIITRV